MYTNISNFQTAGSTIKLIFEQDISNLISNSITSIVPSRCTPNILSHIDDDMNNIFMMIYYYLNISI